MRELADNQFTALEIAEIDARRLLDSPTMADIIEIDARADIRQRWTADDALYSYVDDGLVRVEAFTDNDYTRQGIDTVIGLLKSVSGMNATRHQLNRLAR